MSIGTPQSLGTSATSSALGTTFTITTTNPILAGDLVFVSIGLDVNQAVTVQSVSDGTNSYTKATSSYHSSTAGIELWYKENAAAVSSSATITVTLTGSVSGGGSFLILAAGRVTGVLLSGSLDKTATADVSNSCTTSALSQAVEIAIGTSLGENTYTVASGFTNLSQPGASPVETALDYKIVSATTAVTYAPSWSANPFASLVATFIGIVLNFVDVSNGGPQLRRRRPVPGFVVKNQGSQIDFNPPAPFVPFGFSPDQPQPPHPRPERAGAIMPREDGAEAPFIYVPPIPPPVWPFEDQAFQPPALRVRQRAAAVFDSDADDVNDQPPILNFVDFGFENQPPQPPNAVNKAQVRAGGTMRGDDGTQAAFIRLFFPLGFPVQDPQPPHPPREKRAGATMRGDDGTQAKFIRFVPVGWEPILHQPQHPTPEKRAAGIMPWENGIEAKFIFVPVNPAGWEVQSLQPPAWTPARLRGAFLKGDDGIAAPFFAILDRFDFGPESFTIPRRPVARQRHGALARGDDGTQAQFFAARMSFDMAPQTLLRKRQVVVDFTTREDGIEAPVPQPVYGWETPGVALRPRRPLVGAFAVPELIVVLPPLVDEAAWQTHQTELIHRRKRGAAVEIEPFWPPLVRAPWGFEAVLPPPSRRRPTQVDLNEVLALEVGLRSNWVQDFPPQLRRNRAQVALDRGYELVTSFPPVWTTGWEIQAPQPPRPKSNRGAALMRGIDGIERRFVVPVFMGWESVLAFPPHPHPNLAGAIMQGDFGAWAVEVFLVPSGAIASDFSYWVAVPFDIGLPP